VGRRPNAGGRLLQPRKGETGEGEKQGRGFGWVVGERGERKQRELERGMENRRI